MSTKTFITTIQTILAPLAGSGAEPLAEVNAYAKKENLALPCINLTIEEGITIVREDSRHNERTTPVMARLIFPNKDGQDAELARLDVLDAVLNKFDEAATIDTLSGVQDIWEVTDVARFDVDEPEPLTGFEITITGRTAVEFT